MSLQTTLLKLALTVVIGLLFSPTVSAQTVPCWADSFAVQGKCYCITNYDHNENGYLEKSISTPDGIRTVREICKGHETIKIPTGERTHYNDVQCGNGPANAAEDEQICPGIPNANECSATSYTGLTCNSKGPTWDLTQFGEPTIVPTLRVGIQVCSNIADIDCSGVTNALDLTLLLGKFGTKDTQSDLDGSGIVNALDLTILLSNFGT